MEEGSKHGVAVADMTRDVTTKMLRLIRIAWASPYTCLGITFGVLGVCSGGSCRRRDGVLGFCGGKLNWLLRHLPGPEGVAAITFGHTVLARDDFWLELTHDHEMVHVRQYERWGPFMGPAYLGCSLVLWLRGRDAYRENPFEREAFEVADPWPRQANVIQSGTR